MVFTSIDKQKHQSLNEAMLSSYVNIRLSFILTLIPKMSQPKRFRNHFVLFFNLNNFLLDSMTNGKENQRN